MCEKTVGTILTDLGLALLTSVEATALVGHGKPTHTLDYYHEHEGMSPEKLFVWDYLRWCSGDDEAGIRVKEYSKQVVSHLKVEGPLR